MLLEKTFALLGKRFAYSGSELLTVASVDGERAFLATGLSMFSLGSAKAHGKKGQEMRAIFYKSTHRVGEVFNAQNGVRYRNMGLLFLSGRFF